MRFLPVKTTNLVFALSMLSLNGSVSSPNPFLRPGSEQKPPPVRTTSFNPKPVPQKDMSKEVEFRGYFLLKGKPFFCLFNKKSNHAEWISLSEITYEEFEAHEFDMGTEVLTILYEGQSYELSLLQGGSSTGSSASGSVSSKPLPKRSTVSPTIPKYMPPRPQTAPQLPEWLVNKKSPSNPFPQKNAGVSSSRIGGVVPRRVVPNLPFPTNFVRDSNNLNTQPINPSLGNRINNSNSVNVTNSTASGPMQSTENLDSALVEPTNSSTQSSDFDLEGLPPPPPPPNITPPSPPPNILPSLEN